MYTINEMSAYPYFKTALETIRPEMMLDSLTGLISRPWILRLTRDMIARGTPFALAIVDLDNFKAVNDGYGHHVGDEVLAQVGMLLQSFVGSDGIVGRYGGDEFLILYHKNAAYQPLHDFFDSLFDGGVFRREYYLDSVSLTITATVGCACFPKDGGDFDSLFSLADKALYRGKTKGRNCFILYVPEKHAHLQITTLTHCSLYDTVRGMTQGFDAPGTLVQRLHQSFLPLRESFHLFRLLLLDKNGRLLDTDNGQELGRLECAVTLPEEVFAPKSAAHFQQTLPELHRLLVGIGFDTALLAQAKEAVLIFCPEPHATRIWQDAELAMAFLLLRMVEGCQQE